MKPSAIVCFNQSKTRRLRESLTDGTFEEDAAVFKALGNSKRLELLHVLCSEPCCVCDLSHILECSIASVSQHLKLLKSVGLVDSVRDGKFLIYSVTERAALYTRAECRIS